MTPNFKLSRWKIICKLLPYIWSDSPYIKIRIIIGLLLIVATIFINLSVPLILKNTIESLNIAKTQQIPEQYQWASLLLLTYGSIYTLGQIVLKARQIIFYKVIERAMRNFSLTLFNHLHNLDLKYHLQKKIGSITNSVEKFQHAVPDIFWSLVLFVIPTVTEISIAITILFYLYHWSYAVVLLGTLITFTVFSFIGVRWTTIAQTKYDNNMLEVHSHMVDSLLNYETVRYFNNRKYESTLFNKLLGRLETSAIQFRTKYDFIQMIQGVIVGIGLSILIWQAGHEVINETLNIGDFIVINSYLLQFVAPLVNFGWIMVQMNQAFTKLRHVMQLLEEKSEILDFANAVPLNITSSGIEFENVNFHYDPERPILRNLTFKISPGSTLAIVGTTGSGKSTIARLLFRFYDVIEGRILINGQDIRCVSQDSLHAAIGVVAQDTVLFNTTLYENILYANQNATKEEVETVVKLAHLNEFIANLPNGYNTIVGERGLKLSGGEKQRVSIARALLKKPSIFLFDEATSSLDTATEEQIKKNIMEISAGSTTIVIAHRLSTVTYANKIIVLDQGKIVEQGKHSELLALNGVYARLWYKQVNNLSMTTLSEKAVLY
jgi:ATP-binding cassette subfamily B protein